MVGIFTLAASRYLVTAKREPQMIASNLFGLLMGVLCLSAHTTSHAIEEPEHVVVRKIEGVEVRDYAAYTVAEVTVVGPSETAGNRAFPILAGYIFGKNKGDRKMAMTAPVTQGTVPVKLEMTAPVTQSTNQDGFLVQFVLPRGLTVATAPAPLDPRVMLRDVPPRRLAAIRYSGSWTQANDREHLDKLQATLMSADIKWVGEPVLSRYNAPFTPWFIRRNEIWLSLETPL
jgi:hypothetical protein